MGIIKKRNPGYVNFMSTLHVAKSRARSADATPMVTMRQVAQEAGVSYTTVSFVINGNDTARGIGAATRERVLETARRLGYRHNGLARAVSLGRSQVLAVALQTLELEFRTRILSGILEAAEESGYFVKVVSLTDSTLSNEKIEQLAQARVAGVVAVNVDGDSLQRLRAELERYGGLVAMVDDVAPQGWGIRISSDNENGMRVAFEHLQELGHRKLALVSGPFNSALVQARHRAFNELSEQHGLAASPIIATDSHWTLNAEQNTQICELLRSPQRPTAFICMGDLLAMRVIKIAHSLGMDIPQDLSVVGYGNFAIAEVAVPSLTSVAQPFHQMGYLATTHLLQELSSDPNSPEKNASASTITKVLPTHLVSRESSGPVPTNLLF